MAGRCSKGRALAQVHPGSCCAGVCVAAASEGAHVHPTPGSVVGSAGCAPACLVPAAFRCAWALGACSLL